MAIVYKIESTTMAVSRRLSRRKSDTSRVAELAKQYFPDATKRRGSKCLQWGGGHTRRLVKFDWSSNNGFLTDVWGPSMWMVLHTVSLNYPCSPTREQKRRYKTFFDSLCYVLPCGKCRENLCTNLRGTNYGPHVFKNRETLSRWVFRLHCSVNSMLNKETPMKYEEMRKTLEHFRARCSPPKGHQNAASSNTTKKGAHGGCTEALSGIKSRCVLNIVPKTCSTNSLNIDQRCLCFRGTSSRKRRHARHIRHGASKKHGSSK